MAGSVVAATLFDTEKTELSLKWKKKKKKFSATSVDTQELSVSF